MVVPLLRPGNADSRINVSAILQGLARAWCLLIVGLGIRAGMTSPLGERVALVALVLLGLAAICWYFGRRAWQADERTWSRAGLTIWLVASLVTCLWAWAYDSNQTSDFGLYYRCGITLRDALPAWMRNCQSNFFFQPDNTYWTRSLLYTAPFGVLFGDNYPAFKLYNAALHAATMAVLYFGLKACKGARIATVALALFAIYPEWFYAVTVATPDNLAILLVVAFLLAAPLLTRPGSGWAVVPGIALLAFAANMVRTIGPFMVLTLCLLTLTTINRRAWAGPVAKLLTTVALYTLGNWLFVQFINSPAQGQFQLLQRISTIDLSDPLQNYRLVFGWLDQFIPAIPDESKTRVVASKIVLELAQGFANYPAYLYAKTRLLFEGTGYYYYSSTDSGPNPDSAVTAQAFTVPASNAMPWLLGSMVLFQITVMAIALLKGRRDKLFSTCVFFCAVFFLVIVGLGDSQQRYSLLIAPAIAMACALAFSPAVAGPAPAGRDTGPSRLAWTAFGAVLIGISFVAGTFLAQKVSIRIPKPLMNAVQEPEKTAGTLRCNVGKLELDATYKRLKAKPVAGENCFSFQVPFPADTKSLSFFVARDQFPFPFEKQADDFYQYQVRHRGTVLFEGSLGKKTVRWHQLNLPPASAIEGQQENAISFVAVKSAESAQPEPFNVWLMTPRGKAAP